MWSTFLRWGRRGIGEDGEEADAHEARAGIMKLWRVGRKATSVACPLKDVAVRRRRRWCSARPRHVKELGPMRVHVDFGQPVTITSSAINTALHVSTLVANTVAWPNISALYKPVRPYLQFTPSFFIEIDHVSLVHPLSIESTTPLFKTNDFFSLNSIRSLS